MRNAEAILAVIRERGKKRLHLEDVYRQLYNPTLYLMAYARLYSNEGAMTRGTTSETVDGMALKKIEHLIDDLRHERFQWTPVRRTYILKKNGKLRPLGIPTWTDKLLQEAIRLILEAYYEPQFSDHSHGFRPQRSCTTALREIHYNWPGTTWFIEGDISKCFDKLDHELLLETLSEKIHDGRFINLLRKLFDAGYMEDWTFNETLSGVPQGGIVSPLLANILLDKLDTFVETVLIPKYTKGVKRKKNREYDRLMTNSLRLRERGHVQEAEEMRKKAQKLPSQDMNDPDYRRLRYVRYADDFLLGFIGPKSEAEEIKQQLKEFLQETLKLELFETKTLITHARTEAARFLGYEVIVFQGDEKRAIWDGKDRRSINGRIGLQIPKGVLEEKIKDYTRNGKPVHRKGLQNEDEYTIINTYQQEFRGLTNYYRLAYNMHTFKKLKWVMEISLVKTLASKSQITVPKAYEKYGAEIEGEGQKRKVLQVVVPKQDKSKKPLVATWGGISLSWNIKATIEDRPSKVRWKGQSELVRRLRVEYCELCGHNEKLEVHHIRAMKDLHEYPGRQKPAWMRRMIALQRKTLVLCETCHDDVQYGRPPTRPIITLADIKAKQKEAMKRC